MKKFLLSLAVLAFGANVMNAEVFNVNDATDFDGTLILVSHDRDFLDGLVSKVYEFGNKQVKEHLSGIYEFLEKKKTEQLS